MDDRFGRGADIAKRVDMRHHVMSEQFFVMGRRDEIDLINMLPQFIDLRLSDIQSQFSFGFGQGDPQPTPGRVFRLRRPELAHLG